jgi:23S rRNA (adenine1618-N6)-methyltransferase
MSKASHKQEKTRMHPRNKNRDRYDLKALTECLPELDKYVKPNKYGDDSVDFADPLAVKLLNTAILKYDYGIENWEFPEENLVPPVPGRADYIHHMADLLSEKTFGDIPKGDQVIGLDIGVGASCIYPIIGVTEYGWRFIGSDIDPKSIGSARAIVEANATLKGKIDIRLQKEPRDAIYGIISREDLVDFVICNPPFHASAEEAQKGSRRKIKNLSGKVERTPQLNFAGNSNELICEGGEYKFIHNLLRESEKFARNCLWFSTLVSKQSNLRGIYQALEKHKATQVRTIPMGTGNKSTRIVSWTFLSKDEQLKWVDLRFKTKSSRV